MHPPDSAKIQEVVNYCSSRLRASLLKISDERRASRPWWRPCFMQELMSPDLYHFPYHSYCHFCGKQFTLSYIGMAAALGVQLDIPLVIRILASAFHRRQPGADITFDQEFLSSLDAGTDPQDPDNLGPSYHQQWWTARSSPPMTSLINSDNIEAFLEHHRKVTGTSSVVPDVMSKMSYTWSRAVALDSVSPQLECHQCRLYRGVTIGVLDDLRDLRHHVHGLEVSYAANSGATSRRAANLYQLYQAAQAKDDLPSDPSIAAPSKPTKKGKNKIRSSPEQVRLQAEAEFTRLTNLPRLKWTSGSPLTSQEVVKALKHNKHSGKIHSDYIQSLPWGSCGENSDSALAESPKECDCYSDIATSTSDVPNLSPHNYPIHFEFPPLRCGDTDHPHLGLAPFPEIGDPSFVPSVPRPPYVRNTLPPLSPCPTPNTPSRQSDTTGSVSSEDIGPTEAFPSLDISLQSRSNALAPCHRVSVPVDPNIPARVKFADVTEMEIVLATQCDLSSDSDLSVGPGDAFPSSLFAQSVSHQLPVVTRPQHGTASHASGSQNISPPRISPPFSPDPSSENVSALPSARVSPSVTVAGSGKTLAPIPPAVPIHEVEDPDSDTSVDIGPLDAFPIVGSRASSRTGSHSAHSVSAFIPPSNGSDSGSDFDSDSSSDEALDPGPWDAFPRVPSTLSANEPGLPTIQSHASDSDTDSDMCEVSATEAAAALADSDSDVGHGAMVLAALVGGRLAIGTHPLPPHGPSDPVIPGPFMAKCFPPLPPEMLRESSEDADVDS